MVVCSLLRPELLAALLVLPAPGDHLHRGRAAPVACGSARRPRWRRRTAAAARGSRRGSSASGRGVAVAVGSPRASGWLRRGSRAGSGDALDLVAQQPDLRHRPGGLRSARARSAAARACGVERGGPLEGGQRVEVAGGLARRRAGGAMRAGGACRSGPVRRPRCGRSSRCRGSSAGPRSRRSGPAGRPACSGSTFGAHPADGPAGVDDPVDLGPHRRGDPARARRWPLVARAPSSRSPMGVTDAVLVVAAGHERGRREQDDERRRWRSCGVRDMEGTPARDRRTRLTTVPNNPRNRKFHMSHSGRRSVECSRRGASAPSVNQRDRRLRECAVVEDDRSRSTVGERHAIRGAACS